MSIAGNQYGEVLRPVSPAVLQVPQDLGLEVFLPGIPFDALRCGQKVRKDSSVFRGADIRVKPPMCTRVEAVFPFIPVLSRYFGLQNKMPVSWRSSPVPLWHYFRRNGAEESPFVVNLSEYKNFRRPAGIPLSL